MVSLSTEYTDAFITGDRLESFETVPSSDAFFFPSSDELFLYRYVTIQHSDSTWLPMNT